MDSDKRINPVEKALQEVANLNVQQSTTEAINTYDSWSNYDETLAALNYNGPKVVSDAVVKHLSDKYVRVLDVAAGTGLVAEQLKAHGFNNIDALDPSEGMLNIARQKKVYKNYIHEFFSCEKPSVKTSSYDVLVICGGISETHINWHCLPEMVRCVKSGGLVAIATRRENLEEYIDQFEALMKQLEIEGEWQILERTVIPEFYHNKEGVLFVLKVTKRDN